MGIIKDFIGTLIGILLWAACIGLIGFGFYLEFFKCGGMSGTMADIPRYCWWLR